MNSRGLAPLVAQALLLLGIQTAAVGCGQSVATCSTACPPSSGFEDPCLPACTAAESACASTGYAANFQAYLTCVANAGGYLGASPFVSPSGLTSNTPNASTTEVTSCAEEAAVLATECGTAAPGPSGGTSPDAGTGDGDEAGTFCALDAGVVPPPETPNPCVIQCKGPFRYCQNTGGGDGWGCCVNPSTLPDGAPYEGNNNCASAACGRQ